MPSNNLPYLFAVYAVTWAVFFIYVFFVSRRQHELEKEVQVLKQALEHKRNPEEPPIRNDD